MDRNTIASLAKGLVPFVREVVTDAVTPLTARLAELEARPKGDAGDPGAILLPPELVEQVEKAAEMLKDAPPISALRPATSPKVKRIERDDDGNFVPIYDEPQP